MESGGGSDMIILAVSEKCGVEDFYSFAERLSELLCIQYTNKMNHFGNFWWDFYYDGSDMTLSYNTYSGIDISLRKGKKASREENEALYKVKFIVEGK
jgi:hypothetical protein